MGINLVQFKIDKQPVLTHRYRYKSELRTTHGVILSRDQVTKSEYPSVVLTLAEATNQKIYIFVWLSLALLDNNSESNARAKRSLSSNFLLNKTDGVNTKQPIIDVMTATEMGNEYSYSLKDAFICRPKKQDQQENIETIRTKFNEICPEIMNFFEYDEKKLRGDDCLTFAACTLNDATGQYKLIAGPIYSDRIKNGLKLKIHKVCKDRINIGGEELTLILESDLKTDDFKIVIAIHGDRFTSNWSKEIPSNKIRKEKPYAISFDIPAYDGPADSRQQELKCSIILKSVRNDNESSSPGYFYYYSYNDYKHCDEPNKKKRKLYVDSIVTTPQPESVDLAQASIEGADLIEALIKNARLGNFEHVQEIITDYQCKTKNSIFHRMLFTTQFEEILDDFENLQPYCSVAFNAENENLLHYACKQKLTFYVSFFGRRMGHLLAEQDCRQQTPLHNAISLHDEGCLKEFEQLISTNIAGEEPQMVEHIKRALQVRNSAGRTPIQLAIAEGCHDLVKQMLDFCLKYDINLSTMVTPGHGQSILHLAVLNEHKDIAELIVEKIPEAVNYTNYANETIYELEVNEALEKFIDMLLE